jgi:DNA-3-methyladenine glycosylase
LPSAEIAVRFAAPGPAERKRLLAGLGQDAVAAARFLLGKILVRRAGRSALAARIVETEAYLGVDDPAAHAYGGRRTRRTEPLWGPAGTIYVYFVYGMHHCLNVSVEREGLPGCVLIRAAEPMGRLEAGSLRGPGRLCRTLRLDSSDSGGYLFDPASRLTLREGPPPARIGVSVRVGIRQAADRPLRFFDAESREVS